MSQTYSWMLSISNQPLLSVKLLESPPTRDPLEIAHLCVSWGAQ
jgi:hypothetical protein